MKNLSTVPLPVIRPSFWLGLALIAVSLCATGWSAQMEVPRAAMPLMRETPKIDGRIDEAEWKSAVRNVGLVSHATGAMTTRQGVFWIGCDGRQLLLAMKTELPPDGRILARAVPDPSRDIVAAFLDDSIELVFDPAHGRASGGALYHIITNARGALYDWAVHPDNPANSKELVWRLPKWQIAASRDRGWWEVEMAIPLESLGARPEDLAGPCGLDVARNWKRPAEQSQWRSAPADYDDRATMPVVTWDAEAPVTRVLGLAQEGKPRIEVAVFNPHGKPVSARVWLSDAWHRDPPRGQSDEIAIPAGGEEVVRLDSRDGGPDGLHQTTIRVTSPDGRRVFYHRSFRWSLYPPADRWSTSDEQKQQVDVQFKYYPYASKVNFRVSVEALDLRDRVTGGQASIYRVPAGIAQTSEVWKTSEVSRSQKHPGLAGPLIWQQTLAFRKHVAEAIAEIPQLAEGHYVFAVRLEGGEGIPKDPVLQPFVRQVFPWEHNRLGISDEVMPPFVPLEVEGETVRAVLREHRHGRSGLWDRAASQGKELLAAPMRWEVVAEGPDGSAKTWPVEGDGWRVKSRRPTAVSGEARWSAGPVRARVETDYDYDGMMRVGLVLAPTPTAAVRRLSLAIPLVDHSARYMHAVGDGLRHNYAGFTPPGQGRIWDSSRANKLEIVGTFFPYLWLGDGERGLCWFADTDRDWVLDEKTPTLDLTREEKTLLLRIHFITRPQELRREHHIVFGLQATPAKPMPEGWRRWIAGPPVAGGRQVHWVGATFYWGGLAYDVYPYHYQFDIFEKLKQTRQTGQIDQKFIDTWMQRWESLAAKGSEKNEFLRRHIQAGFHSAKSSPWSEGTRLFGYTNPRGVGFHVPEFATFQDEWLRTRWFNRNWSPSGANDYDVSPSPSFQDYALWYYRKMLTCFDGVYWDNTFLSAHFDPVVGEAWTDAEGRVHPTLGLWHLRDLVKRTAIMFWQESKRLPPHRCPLVTLSHMTNTMIVPINSFLNCTMDWEWKYGYDDFQDRFSPGLTVAETIGRQVGAWPTILAGGYPDPKDPRTDRLWRTRLGVALVHEMRVFDWQPARDAEILRKLFEFGYGAPSCRVFNYWEDGHPVRVEGTKACTLVLARGKAAIVVVTDYSAGGQCRVTLDAARLGLQAEARAVDLETGQAIERLGPATFGLSIKKHDLRILRVE